MTEFSFATYVNALRPALMKHTEKEDAALFLLNAVLGQEIVSSQEEGKKMNLKKNGTLGRLLRGAAPVPENIRLATADPEVVKGVIAYFRNTVAPDLNPHLKDDMQDSFRVLIEKDVTIPDAKRESLKSLHAGEDLPLFLAEAFIYAINRFSKSDVEDGKRKISIPLLVFTFFYGISIYVSTMYVTLKMNAVSQPLMAFAFFFSLGLFVFLISFYFFLWRKDI